MDLLRQIQRKPEATCKTYITYTFLFYTHTHTPNTHTPNTVTVTQIRERKNKSLSFSVFRLFDRRKGLSIQLMPNHCIGLAKTSSHQAKLFYAFSSFSSEYFFWIFSWHKKRFVKSFDDFSLLFRSLSKILKGLFLIYLTFFVSF